MDPVSTVGAVVAVVSFGLSGFQFDKQAFNKAIGFVAAYGPIHATTIMLISPGGLAILKRMRDSVLPGGVKDAKEFKNSYTSTYNMLGVAGAIIARVAITAYISLPNIGQAHWTASAAFIVSLVSGVLCVYFSCLIQQKLNDLHGAEELRSWLTQPAYSLLFFDAALVRRVGFMSKKAGTWITSGVMPSYSAARILAMPAALLNYSTAAFLVGLGIYLGFMFHLQLPIGAGSDTALAVLIVYVVITAVAIALYFSPAGTKMMDMPLNRDRFAPQHTHSTDQHPPEVKQGIVVQEHARRHEVDAGRVTHSTINAAPLARTMQRSLDGDDDPFVIALQNTIQAQQKLLEACKMRLESRPCR